ncbi:hypothetical protein [Lewinella sp. LCG006]|uniref:hypothetical protein n=1 Tax=Lewinella sp. LCG006 TaxID=3231911 RepID=UPI0034605DFB
MKALFNIRDLLEANKIDEAITATEHHLELFPNDIERQKLSVVKKDYQKAKDAFHSGILSPIQYQNQLDQVIRNLKGILTRLFPQQQQQQQQQQQEIQEQEQHQQSAPPPATAPPPPPRGGIFDKVIDIFRDLSPSKPKRSKPGAGAGRPSRSGATKGTSNEDFETSDEMPPIDFSLEEEMSAEASPPAPPPPAPSMPAPEPAAEVASPFQKGKILYAIPDQMAMATASRCRVRIAPEQISDDELFSGLQPKERENAAKESIKITSVMKVALVEAHEGDNFDIVFRNNEEQPILPFMATEWSFDVTPRRPGHYALLLRVTAKVQVPGYGERPFDVAVLDRAIQVNTTDEPSVQVDFQEQPIPDPEWDQDDEKAVEHALLHGRVDLAIERIINFVQDKDTDFRDTLLLLQFRWNDNSNQLQNKLISATDWDRVNNQVRYAITQLLAELKEHYAPGVAVSNLDWRAEGKNLRERGELV